MTKDDFLKLNREIGQAPPIDTVRIEYMEAQFLKLGLSIDNGYKAVQYFYNELQNAMNEKETIFNGKVQYVEDCVAIVENLTCIFKMRVIDFEKRKNIFYPIREIEKKSTKDQTEVTLPNSILNPSTIKEHNSIETPFQKQSDIRILYRRHPKSLYLEGVPEEICKRYSKHSYCYVEVEGFDEIPVPMFSIKGLEYLEIDIYDIPIKEYAKGFLKGYSSDLVPYLDTLENRKDELYKQLIGKGGRGFKINHSSEGITSVLNEDCYESGIFEGQRYKAWEIVFQHPKLYLEWFQPKNKTNKPMDNFYEDVRHHVLTNQWKIGETEFPLIDYIEERHKEAPYKGKIFYANFMKCMGAMPKHFGVDLFPDIFKETIEYCGKKITEIEPLKTETKLGTGTIGNETEKSTQNFVNNFDNINPVEIYEHFKAGLVDKQYLTEQELNDYLKAAFELKTKPEHLFKLKHIPTKQKIYTVFYTYYKDISQKKHDRQSEYVALLGDYFEGFKNQIIKTNWAKGYKTKGKQLLFHY